MGNSASGGPVWLQSPLGVKPDHSWVPPLPSAGRVSRALSSLLLAPQLLLMTLPRNPACRGTRCDHVIDAGLFRGCSWVSPAHRVCRQPWERTVKHIPCPATGSPSAQGVGKGRKRPIRVPLTDGLRWGAPCPQPTSMTAAQPGTDFMSDGSSECRHLCSGSVSASSPFGPVVLLCP